MTRIEPPSSPPEPVLCRWHEYEDGERFPEKECPACIEMYEASLPDTIKEAEGWA